MGHSKVDWVRHLSKQEMPVLAKVVSELNHLTGNDDTEVSQLSSVILKDPHLTSQVLRIANSVRFNPRDHEINTVTRAIVLIGFNGVRAICISLMVIESLLGKKPRSKLLSLMARAFHGATQARALSSKLSSSDQEEVFIAALLYNLGQMAFWAYGEQTADILEKALVLNPNDPMIVARTLGVSFKELSRELGKAWSLGQILQESLSDTHLVSSKAEAVRLGDAIALASSEPTSGIEMSDLMDKVVRFTGLSNKDAEHLLHTATDEAANVALSYGVPEVCQLIAQAHPSVTEEAKTDIIILEPDSRLQLKLLRELSQAVSERLDINIIFRMVLEGMHRGIGLERVVLAFYKKNTIEAKYVHGQTTDGWLKKFRFPLNSQAENIFDYASRQKKSVVFGDRDTLWDKTLFTPAINSIIQRQPLVIGVLRVNTRNAGLFYADRGATGEPLSEEQSEAFSHFISQAQMSLEAIARR